MKNLKINLIAVLLPIVILYTALPVSADTPNGFLWMRNGENIAVTNDKDGEFKYIELLDSKGTSVAPQISNDGNTYLPFRYICDIMNIADANYIQGEIPENSYRYKNNDPSVEGNKNTIEIRYNGRHIKHSVNECFEYTAADGSRRTVAIYNIRRTLYAPMTYLAELTGSSTGWDSSNSGIVFIRNGLNAKEFVNENFTLKRDKQIRLGYEMFGNNLVNTALYLKTDGRIISDLSKELKTDVRCVSRSGSSIYYIKDSRLFMSEEDSGTGRELLFRNSSNEVVDVYTENAFVLKNKIYGIRSDSPGKKDGYVFKCDLDGEGFEEISDSEAYNLIMTNEDLDYLLFYCEAENRNTLHMIRVNTGDDYRIEITNYEKENMLSGIRQFAAGSSRVYYLDDYGTMHIIELNSPLKEIPIARLKYGNTIYRTGSDGGELNNITTMNFDYLNDTLYIVQSDSSEKVYYSNSYTNGFMRAAALPDTAGNMALFSDINYTNHIAAASENGIFNSAAVYENGFITIN